MNEEADAGPPRDVCIGLAADLLCHDLVACRSPPGAALRLHADVESGA